MRFCVALFGLIFLAPAFSQNASPQIASQSTAAQAAIPQSEGESAAWRGTLARVAESVVAIEIDQTRAFDTEWNSSSQATGFVVDADRGLILTNRHVVTPGPGPGGYKGVGEGGAIGAPPAVVNAVADALSPFGATVERLPLSPEAVVRLVEGRQPAPG